MRSVAAREAIPRAGRVQAWATRGACIGGVVPCDGKSALDVDIKSACSAGDEGENALCEFNLLPGEAIHLNIRIVEGGGSISLYRWKWLANGELEETLRAGLDVREKAVDPVLLDSYFGEEMLYLLGEVVERCSDVRTTVMTMRRGAH